MARYLVMAHQTAESPELLGRLQDIAAEDKTAEFVLLVPATPVCNTWVCDEEETVRVARVQAADAERRMRGLGLNVISSRIGDSDPIEALRDELQINDRDYAGVVISTLPPGISRWLKMDVPARAARLLRDREVISVVSSSISEQVDVPGSLSTSS